MNNLQYGGQWTEIKLEILRKYLDAYTTALKNQHFKLIYVDAFAGPGWWNAKLEYDEDYGEFRVLHKGSPRIAIEIDDKPFDRLIFVEKDASHSSKLCRDLRRDFPTRNIKVINEDANIALPKLCSKLKDMDRAIVFLDPYATEVAWSTVESIARTKKIDCWILFPLMAISRMMPRKRKPDPALQITLDRIFGGRQYWENLYTLAPQQPLLPNERNEERPFQDVITELYRKRLESIFEKVAPTRRKLCNSGDSAMFELIFAASNPAGADTAVRIANQILGHW